MNNNNHYAINWTDGVKITKDHFVESYFNTVESLRDSVETQMHSYDYGLLAPQKGMQTSLEIETKIHTEERLVLELRNCNAITAKGCKIAFNAHMYGGELPTASIAASDMDANNDGAFYLVVAINPFALVPVGEPDPEVIPLHHPYVLPKIELKILSESQYNTNFLEKYYLLVGKIQWKNKSFTLDTNYIPPVSRIMCHEQLHGFYKKVTEILLRLRNYSVAITKKNASKSQSNPLARNTILLSRKIMDFVSQHSYEFSHVGEEQSPIYIAQKISILANYLFNELSIMNEGEKEKLLQYYYEWIDVKPSVFETTLGDAIDIKYDHQAINTTLGKVDAFMATLDKLWKRLGDLEYIGQRKDNIVISEESITPKNTNQNDTSWSLID